MLAEVVGFKNEHMLLMPYQNMSGTRPRKLCAQYRAAASSAGRDFLRGRIINAMGQPIDGGTAFPEGKATMLTVPILTR